MDLVKRFQKTIKENGLINQDDSILIALSGGPDSTALLRLLAGVRDKMNLTLGAIYVNHQLRKKAARAEENFCQELCDRFDLELDIATEDIKQLAKERGQSIEEAARDFRYDLFETLASEKGYDRIAVGHHLNDQAETIMFRIIRGTGLDGLAGMPARRGRIIRPLLGVTKNDILDYLKENDLAFCRDRSNESIKMSRNFIRNNLLRDIRKRLNPQVDEALVRLGELVKIDLNLLDRLAQAATRKCVRLTPGGKFELVLSRLSGYDGAVQRRLIRHCLRQLSPSNLAPEREVVERLIDLIGQDGMKISLPGRLTAKTETGKLFLYLGAKLKFSEAFEPGRRCKIPLPRLTFRARVADGSLVDLVRKARSRRITIDWQAVSPPLVVRSVKPGDRFQPLGMSGSKKISDFLIDTKWPEPKRDEVALVCDRKGIVWVAGHQIDDRVKLTRETKKVLFLEFSRRNQD